MARPAARRAAWTDRSLKSPWNQEMRQVRGGYVCPELREVEADEPRIGVARSAPDRHAKSLARSTGILLTMFLGLPRAQFARDCR